MNEHGVGWQSGYWIGDMPANTSLHRRNVGSIPTPTTKAVLDCIELMVALVHGYIFRELLLDVI